MWLWRLCLANNEEMEYVLPDDRTSDEIPQLLQSLWMENNYTKL